jgi:hypothetical protein
VANTMMRKMLAGGLLLAAAVLPATAHAGNEDRARAAVASAQAKLDTGEKLGMTDAAADIQARARAALAEAQRQIRDDDEDSAYHAAQRATALADLAIATAELKKLTAERDRLAAR